MHLQRSRSRGSTGFTLVELVIVMLVIGVLAVYAVAANGSSALYSLSSQAQGLARDMRHVQALATSWGRSLRVTAVAGTNGSYSVSCVTAGAAPCDNSPVIDPATGAGYTVTLQKDVVLAGPATLDIDSSGKPSAAASYTLTSGSAVKTVAVQALTGCVTVAP